MKITTLLPAALAVVTLVGVAASSASAAPAPDGGDVRRAVRSPNGKDVFVHVVKVPRRQTAALCVCPKTDPAQPDAAERPAQG